MNTEASIDKFIELRAQGWTLGHIATELHYSKRTLVDWNREYAKEIQSVRATELELLKEKFLASREEELTRLTRLQKDVEDELASRPLKFIPLPDLFKLAADLRKQIHELRDEPKPNTVSPPAECGRHNGNGHHQAGSANSCSAASEPSADGRLSSPALRSPGT